MLKNTRLDLVQNQPIENIPNHHFIYSDTTLLDDEYSPPTYNFKTCRSKISNTAKMTTKIKITSKLQPSPTKQYKDQHY